MKIAFLFPKRLRDERFTDIESGLAPKEFFYGYFDLIKNNFDVSMIDSRKDPKGFFNNLNLYLETQINKISISGLYKQRIVAISDIINNYDLAISFTDWFSITLGLYRDLINDSPFLFGGFHGLSDILTRVNPLWKTNIKRKIIKSLNNLDHIFFFGEADRRKSIELFNIPEEKTSLFLFGVDKDFWKPDPAINEEDFILSVGSDVNRDYDLLLDINAKNKIKIITKRHIDKHKLNDSIELIKGSLRQSFIDDCQLRDYYRRSMFVIVPLKDVYQPSGYSVTLQAMACGKPVILSNIKGLWDPELFISGDNCILVEPCNLTELQNAVDELASNKNLRYKIGKNALITANKYFSLDRMNKSISKLIKLKK